MSLKSGGKIAVITFHSLEDRIVKHKFQELEGKCDCPKNLPYCIKEHIKYGRIITRKPIIPSAEEQRRNSRSQSSKLRAFERI